MLVIMSVFMLGFLAGINADSLHVFHTLFALSGPIGTDACKFVFNSK